MLGRGRGGNSSSSSSSSSSLLLLLLQLSGPEVVPSGPACSCDRRLTFFGRQPSPEGPLCARLTCCCWVWRGAVVACAAALTASIRRLSSRWALSGE
jgi:hypothetical protein